MTSSSGFKLMPGQAAASSLPLEPAAGAAVVFEQVSFSYDQYPVLDDVSFQIKNGHFAALVGHNGAGKTTILRLILGLAQPHSGLITVLGTSPRLASERLGYVPQTAVYDPAFPISVAEVVRMGCVAGLFRHYCEADRQAAARAMETADVADLAERPYAALSGGQRKRVLIARALAAQPQLLVLDEPSANMDSASEERLYKTLASLKGSVTILVVTHDSQFVADLADQVLQVKGEAAAGRTVEERAS